jgi:hypothetical protein
MVEARRNEIDASGRTLASILVGNTRFLTIISFLKSPNSVVTAQVEIRIPITAYHSTHVLASEQVLFLTNVSGLYPSTNHFLTHRLEERLLDTMALLSGLPQRARSAGIVQRGPPPPQGPANGTLVLIL